MDTRQVLDALPGLLWTVLPDGKVDAVNQRWCDYTGLRDNEVRAMGWQVAVHPHDLPALQGRLSSNPVADPAEAIEARLRRFDGTYRWFQIRIGAVVDDTRQPLGWCALCEEMESTRQADARLPASTESLRSIADTIPVLVALMSPQGQLESVNRHVLDYFGATLDQLKDWATTEIIHPDDLQSVMTTWSRSLETGAPYEIEHRMRRADGVYRWFHVRGNPLRNAAGRILLWLVVQTDVDDRRRSDALLFAERGLLEVVARGDSQSQILDAICRLVEGVAGGCLCSILLADAGGLRTEAAAAPSLPSGFVDSLLGRSLDVDSTPCGTAACLNEQVIATDLNHDTRWPAWRAAALAHGLQACWSTPIASSDGRVLGAFAIYHRHPASPTPLLQGLIGQCRHIASIAIERVRRDAALRRSEAFLSETQRLSSTGGLFWNLAGDELVWSDEVYRIFEVDPALPPTLELTLTRLHPEDIPSFLEMRDRQMREFKDFSHEYRLLMPDGSVKFLHVVAHANRDHLGRPRYTAAVQDVTERRLSEQALSRVRSDLARIARVTSLGTLTASIAHEVSQPLAGIITNASTCVRMLGANPPNVDGAIETARRTIRDGNRASDVITRLRALFANRGAATERVDLNAAAREVMMLLQGELQRSRSMVRLDLAGDLPPVTGDRIQLQQVILNLVLNAAEAMSSIEGRPRRLSVRTAREAGQRVRLDVQDSGVGLDPPQLDRLFDAFYTTKPGGMGIGLSVSRTIVEAHRGRLWATPNDGPGATFSISVPCQDT